MPVYRYTPAKTPCKLCGDGFDHQQNAGEPTLTACPKCGQSVSRVLAQTINTPKLLKPLSVSSAKQAGFSVLKRTSNGDIEKQ